MTYRELHKKATTQGFIGIHELIVELLDKLAIEQELDQSQFESELAIMDRKSDALLAASKAMTLQ